MQILNLVKSLDVLEAILSRRSIRKYLDKSVPDDLIRKVLEAGRWAPSGGNRQPWKFIVIRDKEVKRRIAEATTGGKFLAKAPVGIAVVIDPQASRHPMEDGANATMCMLLAAHGLGLGACWIGAYNSIYEDEVKEILSIPKELRVLSIISLGYPAESPSKDRKPLEELVYLDKYGASGF